jgi:MFS family permease
VRAWSLGVLVACGAHFLIGVDGLAVAIALPAIQTDLEAAPIDAQWVLTAYGLAFGGSLLLGGRLGDHYGRRRLLVGGMALFAGASLLAGLAPGLWALVAARALQGLGAAAAVPAALALIGSLLPAGPERTRALSLLGAMASVGIMSGLLMGGVATQLLGWRWVFLPMVPAAALIAVAAPRALPEGRAERPERRLDVAGAALVTVGLMTLLLGVTRIERAGVAALATLAPLVAGAALVAAFVAWERRAPAPLVRFAILRVRSLRAASLGAAANSVAFTAIVYVGTLYLQGPLGYGPLEAGLALLPVDAVAMVVPLAFAGQIARRSPRALLGGSFAFTVLALLWLARAPAPAAYATDVLAPLVVLGASLSIAFVVLTHEAVAEVAVGDKGLASGVFETANHLFGGAVGVAVYATVLAAAGYGAAFLAAALMATLGLAAAALARPRVSVPPPAPAGPPPSSASSAT